MKPNPLMFRRPAGVSIIAAALFFFFFFGPPYVVFAADTPISELMEQGIYTEETKGDLDGAMRLYQQVVARAEAGKSLAAQAQYRLAVCFDKKKDRASATAAYEQLVRDYPDQKDLVAVATEYLSVGTTLRPAPWSDGEEMRFNLSMQSGFKVGVARYSVAPATIGSRRIWQFSSQLVAGGVQQSSRVEAEETSLKPIHSRWKHSMFGDADTVYAPGHAAVKIKGKDEVKNIDLAGMVYDNEEAVQMMRRLPLAPDYTAKVSVFVSLTGGNVLPVRVSVTGREKIQVPAGNFECDKVELSIKQTFWISTDAHHYMVKFEAGGLTAELAAVKQHVPAEPEVFSDPVRGFSVAAPSGWMMDRRESTEGDKRTELVLLDPGALGMTMIKVENLENFDPSERSSIRAFAERRMSQWGRYVKDFSVRAASWKELSVAGVPAISVAVDFMQGKDRKAGRGIYAFVDGMAVDISTVEAPEDFDAIQPEIDAVVASYHGKKP